MNNDKKETIFFTIVSLVIRILVRFANITN